MDSAIRRTLWGAFVILTVLVGIGLAVTVSILQTGKRQEYRIVHGSEPLLDAVRQMDLDVVTILGGARGYLLTQQTQFLQQYDDGGRDFEKQLAAAVPLATSPIDARIVAQLRQHFIDIRKLTDAQIQAMKDNDPGRANDLMLQASKLRRSAPDFAGTLADEHRRQQTADLEQMTGMRQGLTTLMVVVSMAIILLGAVAVWRIERSLEASIGGQVRRTEALIAGMSDGVMLIDGAGTSVFINPAGEKLLGTDRVGIPIDQYAEAYRLRNDRGRAIQASELPAAQALSTGKPVEEVTMIVARGDREIADRKSVV